MIDATLANFETEVVQASFTTPVLVDLWAPWCAPCRSLGPVLEKLETEYAGRFKLVKLNTEDEPDLAAAFGVRSIPMVVLLQGGQPVDGFVGAQPEPQIRQFLDKHVPPPAEPAPEAEAAPLLDRLEDLRQRLATNPADDAVRGDYVLELLRESRADEARGAFEPLAGKLALDRRAANLKVWFDALDATAPDASALQAAIAANRRDFAARFALAQRLLAEQRWTAAMDELLEILMRDKAWNDEAARKAYVAILDFMTVPPAPVPEGQAPAADPTLESYRRRLSMVVLSCTGVRLRR
jgi:putative thioredoxin